MEEVLFKERPAQCVSIPDGRQ